MSQVTPALNFQQWITENQHLLKPPVGNKQVFERTDDFIVMVVGGPNQRADFHVDPYEEFFYQVKGNIHVNLMTSEGPETVHIGEGEMWMLPREVPHSPQRPEEGSLGVVVERIRTEGTPEKFQWYCPGCNALVHEAELQVTDIVTDLPPVFEAFYNDKSARTCGTCGTLHPGRS